MTAPTLDITQAVLMKAMGDYLGTILPDGYEIAQAQQNRVPPPVGAHYLIMTPLRTSRLMTNIEDDPPADIIPPETGPLPYGIEAAYEWVVQLDFYGDESADAAQAVSMALRDASACTAFDASGYAIQPLYADEPRQMPFSDESQQYEERWSLEAHLQFNPVLATGQDYADTLRVDLINVEAQVFGQEN